MTDRRPVFRLQFHPELRREMADLADRATADPTSADARLFQMALNGLERLQRGGRSTHPLEYMVSSPGLSDCETTYVGTDPDRKPTHRLIWRERSRPDPEGPPVRQIIALGEPECGHAYYVAGQRLGRPVGVTLAQLRETREAIATQPRPPRARSHRPAYTPSIPVTPTGGDDQPRFGTWGRPSKAPPPARATTRKE